MTGILGEQMDSLGFLKHLLDPIRLAVTGLVAAAPRTVDELAGQLGQRPKVVLAILAPLVEDGLVARDRATYRLVPERLPLDFEPGRRYTEREVNALLSAYHEDYAALRRYLVDEGFLDRDHGVPGARYWRSGGRVE